MERTLEEYIEEARQRGVGEFRMDIRKDQDGLQCTLMAVHERAWDQPSAEFLIIGNNLIPVDELERSNPAAESFKKCPECGSRNISIKHTDIDSAVRCTDCQWNVRVRLEEREQA